MRPDPAFRSRRAARRSVAAAASLGLVLVGLAAVPAGADVDDDGNVVVDLVGINDFHGRISTRDSNGAVALASAVEDARAANEDTLFVSAGDNFGASTFVSMINDEVPTIQALAAMGLDASALGNHEFDQGTDILHQRIDGRPGEPDADPPVPGWQPAGFPYLAANVTRDGVQEFDATTVVETVNGVAVGFIGALTPTMPSLVTPSGIEGLDFGNMADAVEEAAADLEGEADLVVVLAHDGAPTAAIEDITDPTTPFGELVNGAVANPDIDAVFSGHTHVAYEALIDRDGAAPLPVIQTGSFSEALGSITLTWDPDASSVIAAATDLISLEEYPVLEDNEVVDAVAAIVAEAEEAADVLGQVPVGTISRDLNRAQQSDGSENRGGESTIGNLIADAQLWALEQQFPDDPAQIAFMNPGGIRADVTGDDDGVVTFQQVATAQPFGNTLVTLDLTGAQVVQILEEQWQPEGSSRPFLKLGVSEGLFYLYDPEAPAGERISQVSLDGAPLDAGATYRVVTNSFLAAGGDSFTTFTEGQNVADSGLVDLVAFVDYFAAHEPVEAPAVQRAIGVHWVSAQETAYSPGDEIAVDLSSLSFSTDEPKPAELTLALINPGSDEVIDLGAVDVDNAIVDTTDEVGRAQLRVTVPQVEGLGDPAVWQLQATDEVNGYYVWFDVYLAAEAAPTPTPTPEPTTPAPTTPPAPTPAPTAADDLPSTGAETNAPLLGGALLVALGAALVTATRRRRVLAE
ncbi:bifunctional metallophosphatase/5'-nucleotidase [Georgenia sp. MJ170]|uniref:bifunctional metallophosphatase/5'-nucleotidase n=1 Tax=Georgenia sunbinii TaxID=3117728 RepID=UPI002F26BE05